VLRSHRQGYAVAARRKSSPAAGTEDHPYAQILFAARSGAGCSCRLKAVRGGPAHSSHFSIFCDVFFFYSLLLYIFISCFLFIYLFIYLFYVSPASIFKSFTL
jgi:hypothetical protein